MVQFGPLKSSLDDLFDHGYWLQTQVTRKDKSYATPRRVRVYLMNDRNRYKIKSVTWAELSKQLRDNGHYDLSSFVVDGYNLIAKHYPSTTNELRS